MKSVHACIFPEPHVKSIERYFSKEDSTKLHKSRLPRARHIEGFIDSGLIAPLPIWSPIPKEFQRTARDSFSIWGLEAQRIEHLPLKLRKLAYYTKKRGNIFIALRKEAHKNPRSDGDATR